MDGDAVRRGDRPLSFDMDLVLAHAKNLPTPVIPTSGEDVASEAAASGRLLMAGDTIVIAATGNAIFTNLGLLVAIGLRARTMARRASRARAALSSPVPTPGLGNRTAIHAQARNGLPPPLTFVVADL